MAVARAAAAGIAGVVGVAGAFHAGPSVALLAGLAPLGPARLAGSRLRASGGRSRSGLVAGGSPPARPFPAGGGAVALTFDDGPSPATTPGILDLLDDLGLRATFFLLGEAVAAAPGLALEVARRGHEIGCHGMAHVHHLLRPPWAVLADTAAAMDQLASLGLRPRWYRPPFGQVAGATLLAAHRAGCEVVLWSGWGREFAERRPEPVLARLSVAARPGAVLLAHDSDACAPLGTADLTRTVLPGLAALLRSRGLVATTLGELMG